MSIFGIALCQASGNEQLFQITFGLVGGHLQDGVDGFLLDGIDEAAGVHKDYVRLGGIGDDLDASPFVFL